MASSKFILLGCLTAAACAVANGQLSLLTAHEVAQIVDRVPAVAEQRRKAPCTYYEITFPDAVSAAVGVRNGCSESGSGLFGYFNVDRRTGLVTAGLYGEQNPVVSDGAVIGLATELAGRARGRVLSAEQARCIAAEAVRGELEAADNAGRISATVLPGPREGNRIRVLVVQELPGDQAGTVDTFVSVDVATGEVRNDSTGLPMASAALGVLLRKLFILAQPVLLSDQDALLIASQVPALSKLVSACSALDTSEYGNGEGRFIALRSSCAGNPTGVTRPVAIVNLTTGRVQDPSTGSQFQSPEASRVAAQALARIEGDRREASASVARTCQAFEH